MRFFISLCVCLRLSASLRVSRRLFLRLCVSPPPYAAFLVCRYVSAPVDVYPRLSASFRAFWHVFASIGLFLHARRLSAPLGVFARLGVGTKSSSHSSTVNDVARCEFHPHAYVSPEDVTANEFLLPDAIAATSATSTRRGASTE